MLVPYNCTEKLWPVICVKAIPATGRYEVIEQWCDRSRIADHGYTVIETDMEYRAAHRFAQRMRKSGLCSYRERIFGLGITGDIPRTP